MDGEETSTAHRRGIIHDYTRITPCNFGCRAAMRVAAAFAAALEALWG